jgi:hypothetical protein
MKEDGSAVAFVALVLGAVYSPSIYRLKFWSVLVPTLRLKYNNIILAFFFGFINSLCDACAFLA